MAGLEYKVQSTINIAIYIIMVATQSITNICIHNISVCVCVCARARTRVCV